MSESPAMFGAEFIEAFAAMVRVCPRNFRLSDGDARILDDAATPPETKAQKLVDLMWESAGSPDIARKLAAVWRTLGQKQANGELCLAISRREDAVTRDHRNAAFAMHGLNRRADAVECWERVRNSDPSDPDAEVRLQKFTPQAAYEKMRIRAAGRLRRPSFAYKVAEQIRFDASAESVGLDDIARGLGHKAVNHDWASSLGVRVAKRLARSRLGELSKTALPDAFVIKPTDAHSSRGVRLLRRTETAYLELRSRVSKTLEDWVGELSQDMAKYSLPDDWFVEELLLACDGRDTTPDAIDVFCFHGQVGCIYQRRSEGMEKRVRWYDAQWRPIDAGPVPDCIDPTLEPPANAPHFVETAIRLSRAIARPFMRVDLCDARGGLAFGELTPHPGWYEDFTDEWDRRLGELWEDAEVRLRLVAARD